jgi:hypothetical protein
MTDQMSDVPMSPAPQQKKSGSNTTLIVVIVLVVLLCCCCLCAAGGYYTWMNGDKWIGLQGLVSPLLRAL